MNKRNFKSEIDREKININLDKIADLPYMSLIFAYGSKEAIMLMTNMQQLNYRIADHSADADNMELIPYSILLLCQMKYNLTGIKINPEYWFRMRLSDCSSMEKY